MAVQITNETTVIFFAVMRARAGCAHTLLMVGVSWLAACAGLALGGLAA